MRLRKGDKIINSINKLVGIVESTAPFRVRYTSGLLSAGNERDWLGWISNYRYQVKSSFNQYYEAVQGL